MQNSLVSSYSFINKQGREQQYCRLAYVQNNRINLKEQGLEVLEQYDYICIVTLEGSFPNMPTFMDYSSGFQIKPAQDTIWISRYPVYSPRLKRYVITLKIAVNDQYNIGLAHCFCCLISNVIILGGYQNMSLRHLTMPSKYVKDEPNQGQNPMILKQKIAALIGLSENSQSSHPTQNIERFSLILQQQAIPRNQLEQIYPYISGFQVPSNSGKATMANLFSYLEQLVQKNYGNHDVLIHGPAVQSYITILVEKQYNLSNIFKPNLAQYDITVQQNFQQYLNALQTYNSKCKQCLGNESQPNVENQLKSIRFQTEQLPLFKNNSYYSAKVSKHIDRKQQEIVSLNQQLSDAYNLNLLQKQSSKSLETVRKNRMTTQREIAQQIDGLTQRYNSKARGNNSQSQKLLSEFLQIFVPTMYAEVGGDQTDAQLDKIKRQNMKLEQQIKKFSEKKSAKGKCCSVM